MTSDNGRRGSPPELAGTAIYIASMARELSQLAKSFDFDALAYILDMARLEADQVSRRFGGNNDPGGA